jgi:hypothetical protein
MKNPLTRRRRKKSLQRKRRQLRHQQKIQPSSQGKLVWSTGFTTYVTSGGSSGYPTKWQYFPPNVPGTSGLYKTALTPNQLSTTYATNFATSLTNAAAQVANAGTQFAQFAATFHNMSSEEWAEEMKRKGELLEKLQQQDAMASSDEAPPDVMGYLEGYRMWWLTEGDLYSLAVENQRWDRIMHARHEVLEGVPDRRGNERSHISPVWNCLCGIWAVYAMRFMPYSYAAMSPSKPAVIGKIRAWGKIVEHEEGFRAQHAEVVELYLGHQLNVRYWKDVKHAAEKLGVKAMLEPKTRDLRPPSSDDERQETGEKGAGE